MNNIGEKVKELFENGTIELFIGYEKGTRVPRPLFVSKLEDVSKLIWDDSCTGNLAVYLTRKDLVGGKKVGVVASYYTLKSIAQLFDENQLHEDNIYVLVVLDTGETKALSSLSEIKDCLKNVKAPQKANEDELIARIDAMSSEERWEFWTNEMSKCFKCYACRSACPMCYCTRCIVENNRPQWIQPWASTLGNMEWQINRVMHMAGRCSDCGSCGAACPLGIPIHLLTHKMKENVLEYFGDADEKGNVLSRFKPADKENFIL